jgi:methanogenic corrinoid protein MtbC1
MAAKLSGVSELSIRSWEGRYSAVSPNRTETNRRIYSDSDIEKLVLLKKLTQHGHRIGNLAGLSIPTLTELLFKAELANPYDNKSASDLGMQEDGIIVNSCIEVIEKFDDKQLLTLLHDASVKYSQPDLIEKVLLPLMIKIGKYWESGALRVSHEHFTSAVLIKFLNTLSNGFQIQANAPKIIITTPEGHYHEVEALIGSSLASSDGWRTTYLGASLPSEEIAAAAAKINACCIFLSIVYPNDNPAIHTQLNKLRVMVGKDVFIIVSCNDSTGVKNIFPELNILSSNSPKHFKQLLRTVREQLNPNKGENIE